MGVPIDTDGHSRGPMACEFLRFWGGGPMGEEEIDKRLSQGMEVHLALGGLRRDASSTQIIPQRTCHIMRHIEYGVDGRQHACPTGPIEALRLSCTAEVIEAPE